MVVGEAPWRDIETFGWKMTVECALDVQRPPALLTMQKSGRFKGRPGVVARLRPLGRDAKKWVLDFRANPDLKY
jgi:hypothetical protein